VIARPQERRSYRVYLQKGETLVAEVYARRLDSPLDSLLRIRDESGKIIGSNDDFIRPRVGETLQNFDSYLRVDAPAAGDYLIDIADTGAAGGADYHYYLRLDRPRPDFNVYVSPSAPEIPMVGAEPLQIWVNASTASRDRSNSNSLTPGRIPSAVTVSSKASGTAPGSPPPQSPANSCPRIRRNFSARPKLTARPSSAKPGRAIPRCRRLPIPTSNRRASFC